MIALVGVDGCGKSSVINALREKLRPSIPDLIIIQSGGKTTGMAVIRNHALPPRTPLVSILKTLAKAAGWWMSYHSRYAPKMKRGAILLCDRFYFDDLLLDPLKHRYNGPVWLVQLLRRYLPRPQLTIFLDAPPEVCYSRKQEVAIEELARQCQAFRALVDKDPRGFRVDASAPLQEVVEATYQIILQQTLKNN